ncbi:MAG: hypothetical protein EBR82_51860 [Caulobacteraceae bacterium]|nr:hypothetical protein [Caulobacteraceae bacterium]
MYLVRQQRQEVELLAQLMLVILQIHQPLEVIITVYMYQLLQEVITVFIKLALGQIILEAILHLLVILQVIQ